MRQCGKGRGGMERARGWVEGVGRKEGRKEGIEEGMKGWFGVDGVG